MARVFVSIGSNVNPVSHVEGALASLEARFGPLTLSPVYESRAVGFDGGNFLNLVAAFDSDEPAAAVRQALREVEDAAGRRRDGARFTDRTLDLDLLLYGSEVLNEPGLELPRPEILHHAFVLRPLADIAPDMVCPGVGRTFGELWQAFDDPDQALWPLVAGGERP